MEQWSVDQFSEENSNHNNFLFCSRRGECIYYIYPYYKWYKLCSDSTNSYAVLRIIIQIFDKNSCYTIIQPWQGSIAYKLP